MATDRATARHAKRTVLQLPYRFLPAKLSTTAQLADVRSKPLQRRLRTRTTWTWPSVSESVLGRHSASDRTRPGLLRKAALSKEDGSSPVSCCADRRGNAAQLFRIGLGHESGERKVGIVVQTLRLRGGRSQCQKRAGKSLWSWRDVSEAARTFASHASWVVVLVVP